MTDYVLTSEEFPLLYLEFLSLKACILNNWSFRTGNDNCWEYVESFKSYQTLELWETKEFIKIKEHLPHNRGVKVYVYDKPSKIVKYNWIIEEINIDS